MVAHCRGFSNNRGGARFGGPAKAMEPTGVIGSLTVF
jgi:hypothetical protein